MGLRTASWIGTENGVARVRVYSNNPKTPGGFNTFIFRRQLERSLEKLAWLPIIDGSSNPLPDGVEIGDKSVRYTKEQKKSLIGFVKTQAATQYGQISNDDFGAFSIGPTFADEVQRHAFSTRREIEAVSSAKAIASSMVHIAGSPNEEKSGKRMLKYFEYGLARIRLSDGLYLVLGEVGIGISKRPYYDQHVVAKFKAGTEVTTLQGRSRIGVSAFDDVYDSRFRLIMQGGIEYFFHRDKSLTGRIRLAAHWLSVALRIIRDRLFPHSSNQMSHSTLLTSSLLLLP